MMTLQCSSPRSLPFTIMLSCILIAILLLTTSLDYSHQQHKTSSIFFVSGFSSTSLSISKVSLYNTHHPLKGTQQQSQLSNNQYNKHHQLWSSSTETTTTAEESSSSIPKVKTVKQKKKSTKKYTKKKYKKGGYKKKKSFYKSNFPGKFLYCDVGLVGWFAVRICTDVILYRRRTLVLCYVSVCHLYMMYVYDVCLIAYDVSKSISP